MTAKTELTTEDINFIVRALEKRADVLSEMADLAKTGDVREIPVSR